MKFDKNVKSLKAKPEIWDLISLNNNIGLMIEPEGLFDVPWVWSNLFSGVTKTRP